MPGFDISASMQKVASHLMGSGYLTGGVLIGEPKGPVEDFTAGVMLGSDAIQVVELTLGTTIERHGIQVRLYHPISFSEDDDEQVELRMAQLTSDVMKLIAEDFQLGDGIRQVDIGGIYGSPMAAQAGYLQIDQTQHRIVDITVPLIVDDTATMAP